MSKDSKILYISVPRELHEYLKSKASNSRRSLSNYLISYFFDKMEKEGYRPGIVSSSSSVAVIAAPPAAPRKICRKCSISIEKQEYEDFGGYCHDHGKKK